jgi:hypothetical protein
MARQDCLFDAEGIEERDHVCREVLDPVSRVGLVGRAVPALRHRNGAQVMRQEIENGLVRPP